MENQFGSFDKLPADTSPLLRPLKFASSELINAVAVLADLRLAGCSRR